MDQLSSPFMMSASLRYSCSEICSHRSFLVRFLMQYYLSSSQSLISTSVVNLMAVYYLYQILKISRMSGKLGLLVSQNSRQISNFSLIFSPHPNSRYYFVFLIDRTSFSYISMPALVQFAILEIQVYFIVLGSSSDLRSQVSRCLTVFSLLLLEDGTNLDESGVSISARRLKLIFKVRGLLVLTSCFLVQIRIIRRIDNIKILLETFLRLCSLSVPVPSHHAEQCEYAQCENQKNNNGQGKVHQQLQLSKCSKTELCSDQQNPVLINYIFMTEMFEEVTLNNIITMNFTYVEERLKKNFQIILARLNRLENLAGFEEKIKTIEKQIKFANIKIDTIAQRLPESGMTLEENDIVKLCSQKVNQILNGSADHLKSTKLFAELRESIEKSLLEKMAITHFKKEVKRTVSKQQDSPKQEHNVNKNSEISIGQNGSEIKLFDKLNRQSFEKYLNREELSIVQNVIRESKPPQQLLVEMTLKLEKIQRYFEEHKISKGVLENIHKDIDKFEQSQVNQEKPKTERTKRESKQARKQSRKLVDVAEYNSKGQPIQQNSQQKVTRKHKSVVKFALPQKIEKRLRVEQLSKDINPVLKEIEARLDSKVGKQTFINFMQEFEERLQILKLTKSNNDSSQSKRALTILENKLQAIISFLQTLNDDQDPLIVKKKWTCISCDKNAEKYSGKLGNHINWQTLGAKKMSPTKVGAFGQTVLFASKVKSIVDMRKGLQTPEE